MAKVVEAFSPFGGTHTAYLSVRTLYTVDTGELQGKDRFYTSVRLKFAPITGRICIEIGLESHMLPQRMSKRASCRDVIESG